MTSKRVWLALLVGPVLLGGLVAHPRPAEAQRPAAKTAYITVTNRTADLDDDAIADVRFSLQKMFEYQIRDVRLPGWSCVEVAALGSMHDEVEVLATVRQEGDAYFIQVSLSVARQGTRTGAPRIVTPDDYGRGTRYPSAQARLAEYATDSLTNLMREFQPCRFTIEGKVTNQPPSEWAWATTTGSFAIPLEWLPDGTVRGNTTVELTATTSDAGSAKKLVPLTVRGTISDNVFRLQFTWSEILITETIYIFGGNVRFWGVLVLGGIFNQRFATSGLDAPILVQEVSEIIEVPAQHNAQARVQVDHCRQYPCNGHSWPVIWEVRVKSATDDMGDGGEPPSSEEMCSVASSPTSRFMQLAKMLGPLQVQPSPTCTDRLVALLAARPAFGDCSRETLGVIRNRIDAGETLQWAVTLGSIITWALAGPDEHVVSIPTGGPDLDLAARALMSVPTIIRSRIRQDIDLLSVGACADQLTNDERRWWRDFRSLFR
jgi:hypothetical protein